MNVRVTVSLPASLVKEAERAGKRLGEPNRSAAFARALRLLLSRARERELDAALDAYYGTRTAAERSDDRRMVRAFNRSQRRRNLDDEGK
jgi:metal-responsive CopG/Arc/MetJ family transcriptional regulator